MDMTTPYISMVHLDEDGNVTRVIAMSNTSLDTFDVPLEDVPEYLAERIALLKMCDVNLDKRGEAIGRRFNSLTLYVYLTYDELKQLNPLPRVTT